MSNEKYIDFEMLPADGKAFISNNSSYAIDDKETEAEMDNMIGGPMTAVETLLEGSYYNEAIYRNITCDYDNIKNSLSKEAFEELKQTMLTNAYQYSLVVGQLAKGFEHVNKVYYINPKTSKPYSDFVDLLDDFDKDKGIMFLTITLKDNVHKIDLHLIGFKDGKIAIKTDNIEVEDSEWIKFDYRSLLPIVEEGDTNGK